MVLAEEKELMGKEPMETPGTKPLYSYEVKREGGEDILYINYLGAPFVPSLSESGEVMERTVDALIENPNVSRIVFVQQKNYNYDFRETGFLLEIAQFYVYLVQQEKILSREKLMLGHEDFFPSRHGEISSFLFFLKKDPLAAHFEIKKLIIQARINLERIPAPYRNDQAGYISLLERILSLLERTSIIREAMPYMLDYRKNDRNIYEKLFKPDVIPNFTFTRLVTELPEDADIEDQYEISGSEHDKS